MTLVSFVKWFGRLPARRTPVRRLHAEQLEGRSVPAHAAAHAHDHHEHETWDTVLPEQHFLFVESGYLSAPAPAGALATEQGYWSVALDFLSANAGRLGLTAADVADPVVSSAYTDADGGLAHLYLKQRFNGLEVLNADLGIHLTADGRVLTVGGGFVPGLSALEGHPVYAPTPALPAAAALEEVAADLGYAVAPGSLTITSAAGGLRQATVIDGPGLSLDPIPAHLTYVYTAEGVTLAWEYVVRTPDGDHWYNAAADAATGELVFVSDWIDHLATYNVFALPAESPSDGGRTFLVNPADPNASPHGWHDTNGVPGADFADTRGNNVFAQEDADDNDVGGVRPSGGGDLLFDQPLNLSLAPSTYVAAATTNLFYWNNVLHDVHERFGFTEVAGNFQQTNYSGTGLGTDAVRADAQDGSGVNNANFGTPPDGSAPRMQQYIFTAANPDRDSSLDNGIIIHEYGHGVSNRLTGGPANSNALNAVQSGGMGEGWSDYWALALTMRPTDTQTAAYPIGTYALGQPPTGPGIRRFPYTFNMATNPLTFAAYGTGSGQSTQVHNTGELWCSALWDMTWLLVNKHGFDPDLTTGYQAGGGPGGAGNKLALRLVMDGLKLQLANPSFIDARNAILMADVALTGGVNRREIWTVFARRGLGSGAATTGSGSTSLTTSFAVPAAFDNPGVVAQSPAGAVAAAPAQLTVTFSEAMDTGSFDPAVDVVSFTGPGGTNLLPQLAGFDWVNSTTLQVNFAAQAAQGLYTLVLGPQILAADNGSPLDQDGDTTAGEATQDAYTAYFRYDAAPLTVTAVTPATSATVEPGLTAIDVTFSDAVKASSVDAGDLQLSFGTVTAATPLTATTVRYTVTGLAAEGTVRLNLKYGAVTDAFDFPLQFYAGNFVIDVSTQPLPPLSAVAPLGSVAYQGTTPGLVNAAGDTDGFTIALDAGSRVSVVVTTAPGLRAAVELRDPSNALVASGTAGVAGADVLLASVTVPTAGVYRIVVAGASSTTGTYSVQLLHGPAAEAEEFGGAANDTLATAQSLDGAFTTAAGTTQTAAVVGRVSTDLLLLPAEAEANDTPAAANSAVANFAAQPVSNLYQMGIGGTITSGDSDWFNIGPLQAGDVLTVSMAARGGVRGTLLDSFVELWRAGSGSAVMTNDDNGPGIDALLYRFPVTTADTYYVRARGFDSSVTGTYQLGLWLENAGTAPATGGTLTTETESNGTLATANNASTSWRQVQYLSRTAATIATPGDADHYRFQFTAGDLVTVIADATGPLVDSQVAILDANGVVIAQETGDSGGPGFDSPVYAFRVPTTGTYYVRAAAAVMGTGSYNADVYLSSATAPPVPAPADDLYSVTLATGQRLDLALGRLSAGAANIQLLDPAGSLLLTGTAGPTNYDRGITFTATAAGTYFVRVTDAGATDYNLAAVRGGLFDAEPNDAFASAQPLPVGVAAVGAITVANDDWFRITLAAGDRVTLLTATPATGPTLPLNLLDPRLELYDPAGVLIAADDNSAPDGRNARITRAVPVAGDYRVRVVGAAGTVGEYALDTAAVPNSPPAGVSAGGPYAIAEGSPLTLAAAATDPDGDPLTYSWDVNGDGTFGDAVGANPTVPWATLQALGLDGPFTTANLRVRVTDGFAPVTSAAATLVVSNVNPTGVLGNGGTVAEGSAGSVSFTAQADASPGDVLAGFRYSYDFDDDGVYEVGDGTSYGGSVAADSVTVPAAFLADNPSRTVRARIFDRDGGFTQHTTTITVTNANPTATLGNGGPVTEGDAGSVFFTAVADSSPVDFAAGLRFSYDFDNDGTYEIGDGATYAGSTTADSATVPAAFLADGPAARVVRARIFDKDGGSTEYTTTITITNANPTATLGNGGSVTEGSAGGVSFGGQSDSSALDTAAGFRYSYDFDDDGVYEVGDGTTYAGSVATASASVPAAFLADNPSRTIRARVFDKDGGFTQYTTTIGVTNANPTAVLGNGGPVTEGDAGSVSFSAQSDPSPADTTAGFRYSFDFDDDGLYEVGDGTSYAGSATTASAVVPAAFLADNPGRTIRARIFDKDGGFTEHTTTIAVANANPTATLGNGGPVVEGNPGTVSFTNQADPSPADVLAGFRYSYDFDTDGTYELGDGTTYAGSVAGATTAVPASFLGDGPAVRVVRARVFDKDGGFTQYTTAITVTNANPTATLGTGGPVTEGTAGSVGFTAQTDAAADAAAGFRYSFDFDDDGVYELGTGTSYAGSVTTASAVVPAAFLADGPAARVVRARIFDKDGGFTQYTATIAVTNANPTATLTVPAATPEGSPVVLALDGAADPSAADTAAGFRYSFDFNGDGDFTDPGDVFEGDSPVAALAFPDSGSYPVLARITDRDGGFTEYTATVTVTNVAPTATPGVPAAVAEGGTISVSLDAAADPSAGDAAAGFRYSFALSPELLAADYTAAGESASAAFTLPDDGPVTVHLRVFDKDGGATTYTRTVTVTNVAPTAAGIDGPPVLTAGQPGTYSLTGAADPGADTLRYGFALSPAGLAATFAAAGTANTFAVTPTTPGPFTVYARVYDEDGGVSPVYELAVTADNVPPTAVFSSGGPVPEGTAAFVSFDVSVNPWPGNPDVLRYAYDFDNNGFFDLGDGSYSGSVAAAAATVPAIYLTDNPGRVVLGRMVWLGGFTEYTTTVVVTNAAPTGTLTGPATVAAGGTAAVSFTAVSDPSPTDTAVGLRYSYDFDADGTFDFGDGTYSGSVTAASADVPAALLAVGPAQRTVRGRVIDKDGGFTDSTTTITVTAVSPPVPPPVVRRLVVSGRSGGTAQTFESDGRPVGGAITPFPGFGGEVRVATGDFDADGVSDTVFVTGPGIKTVMAVVRGRDGSILVPATDPFGDANFTFGGFVTAGDIDDDGRAEWVITPELRGGPRVIIFRLLPDNSFDISSPGQPSLVANFFGIGDPSFRDGDRAALGDVNGDGILDVFSIAAFNGGPRTALYSGADVLVHRAAGRDPIKLVGDFFAAPSGTDEGRGGRSIAAGDVDGDGRADLIATGDNLLDTGNQVVIFSGADLLAGRVPGLGAVALANFAVSGQNPAALVSVAAVDADGDGRADVAVGSGAGQSSRVKVYRGTALSGAAEPASAEFDPFGGPTLGGVFVG